MKENKGSETYSRDKGKCIDIDKRKRKKKNDYLKV